MMEKTWLSAGSGGDADRSEAKPVARIEVVWWRGWGLAEAVMIEVEKVMEVWLNMKV